MNKAPLFSHTSDSEQQRLTLAGRFVTSARVLSNEQISHLLRNENQDEIPQLLATAACLRQQQVMALKAATDSLSMPIPSEFAKHWESRWRDVYGVKETLSGLLIPRPPTNFRARFVAMHEKGSNDSERLYRANEKLMGKVCNHWKFCGDQSLSEAVPKHNVTGTFGVWVEDDDEAPYGCLGGINLSTNAVRALREQFGFRTTTLPVRLVHGADVFLEKDSKKQLDKTVATVCAESETADGDVPDVGFRTAYGEVSIRYWDPTRASDYVRFRRAIYLAP